MSLLPLRTKETGRLIHKRHKFIGEAGHCTADADAADVCTAAYAVNPAVFADITLHDRPPTAKLDDAKARTVFFGKLRLFVIAAAVAVLVQCLSLKSHVGRNCSSRGIIGERPTD